MTAGSSAALFGALLGGVWIAYPLAVGVIARVIQLFGQRNASRALPPDAPSVTCILATREGPEAVRARVMDLLEADYDPSRLTVIVGLDSAARCTAADLADLAPRVTVVQARVPGKPSALNSAVAAADGDVLVFADTHQRFDRNAIARLAVVLDDPSVGAVSGNLERGEKWRWQPVTVYWRMERWLRLHESVIHSCVGVTGAIYAMRRQDWQDLGADVLCDDLYVPMRLVAEGKRILFEPGAMARDARDVPANDEFHRKVRTLTGNFQLCLSMKGVLLPWRNPIWFQFVCHKLLRLLSPYLLIGLVLSLLVLAAEVLPLPALILGVLLLAAAVTWVVSPSTPNASLRTILVMFAATLVAGWNAISGEWAVWQASATAGAGGARHEVRAVTVPEE